MLAVSACGTSATDATSPATNGAEVSTDVSTGVSTGDAADAGTIAISTETAVAGSLFDSSIVHEVSVDVDDTVFANMVATYLADGDKEWIEATVTIDGITYENVGLRLKGNSSLRGVTTESLPEELPWLIRLDKYVDDQNHEGSTELVVRSNTTETALNEAVALELLGEAGLATKQAIGVAFSANGSAPILRLVIENPDDNWMTATFDGEGALYKAESTGDWSYRGDDPDSYDEVFDQEAGKDNTDLTPLIDFLDFINNADDETFAAELPERLDTEAFARYLAMMDLVDNFDDIDGPGNNAYLYYDIEAGRFTIVPWDLNLAFGATNGDAGGRGGGQPVGGAGRPEGAVPADGVAPPDGAAPLNDGAVTPGQVAAPGGAVAPGGDRQAPGGQGQEQSNVLVERFKAHESFSALYAEALADLEVQLFDSGVAESIISAWTTALTTEPELITSEAVAADAATIRASIS